MKYSVLGYAIRAGIQIKDNATAIRLGKKASKLCQERGETRESIPDNRWGKVWTYPEAILREAFAQELGSAILIAEGAQ